jgi:hypothetical protein
MSFAYIGTSGRREVAALVSFSIHMSKVYKRTKMPMSLKTFPGWGSRGGQIFVSRSRQQDSTQVNEYLLPDHFQTKWSVFVVQQI